MDKHYNHENFEHEARKLWEKEKIYYFEEKSQKEIFSIDTPPPTVSGTLHTGHIFSYTHTDIIARYKRMKNFNVFYPMGFDDNGLPTERFVEKKHKIKAHMLKRSEFIKLCLKESQQAEIDFENLWKTLALSVDWRNTYSTISDKVRKISQYSFIELFKKNFIYRKQEPALYCTTCQTSVSQAELDSTQIKTTFNDIEFESEDGEKLIISTTRPELLPACVAIFYHPNDKRYKNLENKNAIVPIFNQKVKIISDEKVDPEKGTGLVMCCTFGDQTDIYWYKKYKLPFIQVVGLNGKWTDASGPLKNLRVHEARKKIIELLLENKKLKSEKKIEHAVNVHERCKQEIEFLILPQWFVKILQHKQKFLDVAEKIEWIPQFMKTRYIDWVQNLGWDWCISRQRFYGIPFPVWHCMDCKKIILADNKDLPIDPQEQEYPHKKCPQCSSSNIKPDTDIMDTWATSSLSPQINANWPQNSKSVTIPMSIRPQAHDIIRTWAFYTIVKSTYHLEKIPWKQIVISGHVLHGKEKISKSKGKKGIPTPQDLLKNYSADAIRYWAAQGRLGTDTAYSENQIRTGQRLITKLWNAFRFCKDNIIEYKKDKLDLENFDNLNKWLLHNFSKTIKEYTQYFENYNYTQALEVVEKFFWHNFCDNYLELIKDQIFNPDNYNLQIKQQTQFTIYQIGLGILKLFGPIMPHITETLYQKMYKEKENHISLHITLINEKLYNYNFEKNAQFIDKFIEIVTICRKLKTEKKLSLKTELELLTICSPNQKFLDDIKKEEKLLLGISKSKKTIYIKEKKEKQELFEKDGKLEMIIGV